MMGGRATAGCLAPPFPLTFGGRTTEKESGDMSVMDLGTMYI